MERDLTPKASKELFSGEGGSYHIWDPSELVMLGESNIGAAKLFLNNNGFTLPHYADSSKLAYVLEGNGLVGMVLPDKLEAKVFAIKKGDVLVIPFGSVSWWYNKEDTELIVVFLGDTSKAHNRGVFTYFFLTGSQGIFTGFSPEFVSRAWELPEDFVKTLVTSQSAYLITKLRDSFKMPEPKEEHRHGLVFNLDGATFDVDVKNGGRSVIVNPSNLPLVGEVGLGGDLVRLDPRAMFSPGFSCDSALQVTYIVRGSGRVQVVGSKGKRVLDCDVKAGDLFIVPRFFVVSKMAHNDGLEWFSIITTPNPMFTHLAGSTSEWKALSPEVIEAAFNVSKDVEQLFRSKRSSDAIFFPPN